jgi:lysophospholipase L1-like esterase
MAGEKKRPVAAKRPAKTTKATAKRPPAKRRAPKKTAPPRAKPVATKKAARRAAPVAAPAPKRKAAPPALQPARVVDVGQVLAADPTTASIPDSPEFTHRILAEGDSWFSINAVPGTNLLKALAFEHPTIILNIAEPGDTILRMSALVKNEWMRKLVTDRNFASRWDLLLLSGGGNDLIDSAGAIVKAPSTAGSADPADYVDAVELARLVAAVQEGFRRLADLRDAPGSTCAGKPIVTHTYDYAMPRPSPGKFLIFNALGPWLHRAFEDKGTPNALRMPVTRLLLDGLGDGITALAQGPGAIPNFHVVDTRGTLEPAAPDASGRSGDWENEIHPSAKGYRKLSEVVSPVVRSLLP